MRARTENRIKAQTAKVLYDLTVEYVYHRSQPDNIGKEKELFAQYNKRWMDYCLKQRNNKSVHSNSLAFKSVIGKKKQVIQYQRMLGLPQEKLSFFERIFLWV